MTWQQFAAARLVLAEKHYGTAVRAAAQAEDAAIAATKDAIRRQG